MMKRILSYAALAALTLATAHSAGAQDGRSDWVPTYDYYFYPDFVHHFSDQVGYARGTCNANGGAGIMMVWGDETPFYEQVEVGMCPPPSQE